MGIVVALIILGVGVFAFFVTITNIQSNYLGGQNYGAWQGSQSASDARNASIQERMLGLNNTTGVGNSVFNIIGVIMIIGAIMSIVGLVYNYVR